MGGGRVKAIRRWLPQGGTLPPETWRIRHRAVIGLLWANALFILFYAIARRYPIGHVAIESLIVPAAAVVASLNRVPRRGRTAVASLGLLSSSAILVHLSGGLIEMHFHFFVMVAVVALYHDWVPFLTSIGYVLVHHGALGTIDASSVFNHPAAIANPWRWAMIHALFVAGISIVCIATWSMNEKALLQRSEAEDRLREESRIIETLNEVGRRLTAELDLRSAVQSVTDAATELTPAAFGAFFYSVRGDDGEYYQLYALSGIDARRFAHFPSPRNTAIFAPTFRGDGIVRIHDVLADDRYGQLPPYHGMPEGHPPVRSYLAVPVRSRTGEPIGGLFFGHPEPGCFREVDERVVSGIASFAAIAIDNARLYESERRAHAASEETRDRLAILAEASRVLAVSRDLDSMAQGLVRILAPIADAIVLDVVEGRSLRRARGSTDAAPARITTPPSLDSLDDPIVAVITSGEDRTVEAGHDGPTPGRTALIVPLLRRDRTFGAMTVATTREGMFTESDVGLIHELARRVSTAIEMTLLYEAKRSVAETLQRSLLPETLPTIPGLVLAARYLPGGPGVDVGGDWYDVLQVGDSGVALAMGDVVGKGVPAASLMGQLRNAARAFALRGGGPAEVMSALNDLLFDVAPNDAQFATMILALFDPESCALRICNAGHPPPLIIGPDGCASFIDHPAGPPVGAIPGMAYQETILALAPGSTLVLYTDGLVESREVPLDEGLAHLRRTAGSVGRTDLEHLCDALVHEAHERRVDDDVALLAVHCAEIGHELRMTLPASPTILRPLRATLRRWLRDGAASETETYEILVAAGEACANAIQHAGSRTGTFDIEARRGDTVAMAVRDYGTWREPRPTRRGRGFSIMRAFMGDVDVVTSPGGTTVSMARRIRGTSDDGTQLVTQDAVVDGTALDR